MKFRKKPITVKAVKVEEELIVNTLEGGYPAKIGDYIITGIDGEEYPISEHRFMETYESTTEPGVYIKKALPVFAYCIGDQEIEITKGDGNLFASKNDWLIFYSVGDCYPCKPSIFFKTYEPLDEEAQDLWRKVYGN